MYQTINFSAFRTAFERAGRGDQFSYNGLKALFDYLEDGAPDGRGYALEVIELCCAWTEYDTAAEAAKESGWEADEDADEDEAEEAALEWLRDRFDATVIEFDGGVLVENF